VHPQGDPQSDAIDLRGYLAVLRKRAVLITAITALVAVLVVARSSTEEPRYRSSAEVLLRPRTSEVLFAPPGRDSDGLFQNVATEIEVVRSRSVRNAVRDVLGFSPSVSIVPRGETSVISVEATSNSPAEAARVANVYAATYVETRREALTADLLSVSDQLQEQLSDLDMQLAALDDELAIVQAQLAVDPDNPDLLDQPAAVITAQQAARQSITNRRATYLDQLDQLSLSADLVQTGGAQIVSEAAPAATPFAPTPERDGVLGLMVGLMLGVGVAFLREFLDDSIASKDDLEKAVPGLDLLALVPEETDWKDHDLTRVVSISAPSSPGSESYRTLRTSLQFIGIARRVGVTQVTSASAAEGKTTTLANLGVQLSRSGHRVILVDCDLRRPRLHQFFGLTNKVGFTSVLLAEADLVDAIRTIPGEANLVVVPSGPVPPNPSELLSSARAEEVLRLLAAEADYVLVDSPPVLPVADALVLSRVVDATLVVMSAGRTTRREAHRAWELLTQIDAPLVGCILNSVEADARYDGRYGSYGYTYGQEPPARRRRSWRRKPPAADPAHAESLR